MLWHVLMILLLGVAGGQEPEDTYLKRSAASWAKDLSHAEAKARRAAAFALGKLGKHAAPFINQLKTLLLSDTDPSVRGAIAGTLGELASLAVDEIAGTLGQAFGKEQNIVVRRALALALGKTGERGKTMEPQLRKALDDPDPGLRQNAAWALGQFGKAAEPAIPRLMTALADADVGVRAEAAQALGNLGPLAQDAIPQLVRGLNDGDARVQEQSVLALRKMGPLASSGISSLLGLAESNKVDIALRQAALITIETIWPTGLKEPASWMRLQALAKSAGDEAVKATAQQAEKKISVLRQ
jgi:HEAT repeat protein